MAVPEGVAEDKAWLKQCAVELRTGLQQAATATALQEECLKRVDNDAAPPPSSSAVLDALLKKGAPEPGTPTARAVSQRS